MIQIRASIALTMLAALSACQSYVAVPVQPVTLVAVAQRQKVKVTTKADILFVIDDSLSMSGKQDRIAQALQGFTDALDQLRPPVDYQVAVVTSSVAERFGACGPAGDANAAAQCQSDWGARGFVCDSGLACFRGFTGPGDSGQLYQGAGAPAAVLHRPDYSAQQFASYLGAAVKVGTGGARQPQGLEAMKLTLADATSGFLRDGAKVVVTFFSDAEDCSDPAHRFAALTRDPKTGDIIDNCALESAGRTSVQSLEPVSRYVALLRQLKNSDGSAKEIEVSSIVSLANGSQDAGLCKDPTCDASCDSPAATAVCQRQCQNAPTYSVCFSDCTAECHLFCGGAVPGRRYLEMALAFSGLASNICSDDASGPLGRLAAVIGIPREVVLAAAPQTQQLLLVQVERGGATLECLPGQGYDLVQTPEGQAVRFTNACLLQPDDTWDLRYLTFK